MRAKVFFLTLGAIVALAGAATAQEGITFEQQAAYCDNVQIAYHADLQIGGCTALIRSEDRSAVNLVTAFTRRGQALSRLGEHEAAIADFTAALALDPRQATTYASRAHARREVGAYAASVADWDQVIRLRPGTASDLNSRCWARATGNIQLEQGLADCNASLAAGAGNRSTLDSRGLVKLRLGDLRGALADFTAAYDNTPARAHSLYGRGLVKVQMGRTADGEADIAAATAADPTLPATYAGYGLRGTAAVENEVDRLLAETRAEAALLSQSDQFAWCANADARHTVGQIIAGCTMALRTGSVLASGLPNIFVQRGVMYAQLARPRTALADYDQALRIAPGNILALRNRALARADVGDLDGALADAAVAVQSSPDAYAYQARAEVYAARQQYAQSVADWDEAIRLKPNDGDYHFGRARALEEMESYSRAIADYDRANTLMPNNATVLNARCWARALWGRQLDQALADCDASLRISEEPNTFDSRAMVKLGLNDFAGAYDDFNMAYTRDPNLVVSLYGRGLAQIRLGRTAEGRADIAAALASDPKAGDSYAKAGHTP